MYGQAVADLQILDALILSAQFLCRFQEYFVHSSFSELNSIELVENYFLSLFQMKITKPALIFQIFRSVRKSIS